MSGHTLSAKRYRDLDMVDKMPPELRECVHDFGLPIVRVLVKHGIKKPAHVREIVKEIWNGPRQDCQGGGAIGSVDFALARGGITLPMLRRLLADNNMVIASCEPTRKMLNASMTAVSGYNVRVSKEEKHRMRLRAALRAGGN